jgi:hypothetical protein
MFRRLKDDRVVERVRWLWEYGTTIRTFHFDDELRKACATMQDIGALIRGNFQIKSAVWKKAHENWNYQLVGFDENGDEISIVISIDNRNSILFLITAF